MQKVNVKVIGTPFYIPSTFCSSLSNFQLAVFRHTRLILPLRLQRDMLNMMMQQFMAEFGLDGLFAVMRYMLAQHQVRGHGVFR